MAATTRTITGTIYKLDGTPWAGATLRIDRLDRPMIDSDGTIGDSKAEGTTDANGDVSLTVAVPPSGSGHYRLTHPVESGRPADATYFYMTAGDPITVGEILAASASALPTDAVQTLLNAYLSKADNLASLASAATARTNLGLGSAAVAAAGDFEAALGNPDADGYVLSSTALGVRSWIQSAVDVDDLTTTSGSSTDMLRVAAAGGLEYRTTAQVLADIGAAPTASPTFTGTVTLPTTVASVIKPASDSTTALQLTNAAGTAVLTVDTTNGRLLLNGVGFASNYGTDSLGIGNAANSGGTKSQSFFMGTNAGGGSATASGSVGIGSIAMYAATVTRTVGIGYYSFRDSAASDTTGVGYFTGYQSNANGGVYIGSYQGQANTTANRLMIGNNATLSLLDGIMSTTVAASRLNINGLTGLGTNVTPTAYADIAASTTAAASLRIRSGTAPTTPNAGDLWFDGTNLKFYDGTTTRTISWT